MKKLVDKFGRVHDYLRFSVTDKCNLNCIYCNPKYSAQKPLKNDQMLTVSESYRLIKLFVEQFNFKKVRFTGGEPLVRKEIISLISELGALKENHQFKLGITTNGTKLAEYLHTLKKSGVGSLNISLDTLQEEKFERITGRQKFNDVIKAIEMAELTGFDNIKINCVVMKKINDDEIFDFINLVKKRDLNVRFIEYMPFSSNSWNKKDFISIEDIKNKISQKYELNRIHSDSAEVASNYELKGYKGTISFISSISDHFCDSCNRLRVTSEGHIKLCLFSERSNELDLKPYLRNPDYSDYDIANLIEEKISFKKLHHPAINELVKMKANNMLSIGG